MSGCVLGTSPVNHFLISVLVLRLMLMKSLISVYDDFLERQEKQSWRSKIINILCYPLLLSMRRVFCFAPRCPHYIPEHLKKAVKEVLRWLDSTLCSIQSLNSSSCHTPSA